MNLSKFPFQPKTIVYFLLLVLLSACVPTPTPPIQGAGHQSGGSQVKIIKVTNTGSKQGMKIDQTKYFHNCAPGIQTGTIEFSSTSAQAQENETVFHGSVGGEADIPEAAKVTLEAGIEDHIKKIIGDTQEHTEKFNVEVPPFSDEVYKVIWHEILYEGQVQYEMDGQEKITDYTYRIGFEFESSDASNNACPNTTATANVTEPLAESKWEMLTKLQGHSDGVNSVHFSPNGEMLVTTSYDGTARIWNTRTWQTISVLKHDQVIWDASFSPDNRLVATASADTKARIWEAKTGNMVAECSNNGNIWRVNFSPDGNYIVTAGGDPGFLVRVWDTRACELKAELSGHQGNVWTAVFSPDGNTILTASSDKTARLWNWRSGSSITLTGHTDWMPFATFNKDGSMVLTVDGDKTGKVWNAKTGQLIGNLEGHGDIIWAGSFSPDGKMIATASGDNTVRLWDVSSGKMLQILYGHSGGVVNAIFSPDGQFLGTASVDGTAQIYSLKTGKATRFTGHTNRLYNVAFSPDSQFFVTASADSTALVWARSK